MWTRPETDPDLEIVPGIGLDPEIVPGIGLGLDPQDLELAACLALIENFLDFENFLGIRSALGLVANCHQVLEFDSISRKRRLQNRLFVWTRPETGPDLETVPGIGLDPEIVPGIGLGPDLGLQDLGLAVCPDLGPDLGPDLDLDPFDCLAGKYHRRLNGLKSDLK